ncbi:MAG: PAS domain-containing protein [Rhodospirillaceae bacterium]|nr:PAS domain-containing protein [Rhodospirillaceae bacterium]
MAKLDWIEGLVCFAERSQINSNVIAGVEQVWETLRGERAFPAREEIDPVAFRSWLPYLSVMELHDGPFRVLYRLIGTEVARFAGEDFSGKWLHETGWSDKHQALNLILYERLFRTRQPVYGFSRVDWQGSSEYTFQWALLPLGDRVGAVSHCLSVDDFSHIAPPSGLLRESEASNSQDRPSDHHEKS